MSEFVFVQHDGLTFRCKVAMAGKALPWIVFSNSILTDLTVWDAQADLLEGRFNVLRYDQRGHGGTSVPPGPANFDQLGGDLLALLDHFSIAQATLVGLSMGIPTVLDVVRKQPGRVERLILCDGQSATAPGGAELWRTRIETAQSVGMQEFAGQTSERWFSAEFKAAGGHMKVLKAACNTPLAGFVACARALQDYDYRDVLPEIAVPTMLLVGADDGSMPVTMKLVCQSIPGAVLHEIPRSGHIPCHEQAAVFNRHLADFLGVG